MRYVMMAFLLSLSANVALSQTVTWGPIVGTPSPIPDPSGMGPGFVVPLTGSWRASDQLLLVGISQIPVPWVANQGEVVFLGIDTTGSASAPGVPIFGTPAYIPLAGTSILNLGGVQWNGPGDTTLPTSFVTPVTPPCPYADPFDCGFGKVFSTTVMPQFIGSSISFQMIILDTVTATAYGSNAVTAIVGP